MACPLVSCVPQDLVMVGDHYSMDDLAVSLSTEVTCNLDKSIMVEELSGVLDAPLRITLNQKFSRFSVLTFPVLF